MKSLLLICLAFSTCRFSYSQYNNEPSKDYPFGKAHPDAPKELMDFQPLIGQSKCKSSTRNQDGSWVEAIDMLWTFKYIMNGKAIQDETLKSDGGHSGSIRQFNADSSKWYVHYYSSGGIPKTLPSWEGSKTEDGNIVLYRDQKAPNGTDGFFRLTFYDISEIDYKWIGEWVDTTETVVFPTWKISCIKE